MTVQKLKALIQRLFKFDNYGELKLSYTTEKVSMSGGQHTVSVNSGPIYGMAWSVSPSVSPSVLLYVR